MLLNAYNNIGLAVNREKNKTYRSGRLRDLAANEHIRIHMKE